MKVLAIDFDSTIAQYNCKDPLPEIVKAIRCLYHSGWYILIHTSRVNDCWPKVLVEKNVNSMKQWLTDNRVPYSDIWRGKGKPLANVYIDDLGVLPSPNKNWEILVQECEEMAIRARDIYGGLLYDAIEVVSFPKTILKSIKEWMSNLVKKEKHSTLWIRSTRGVWHKSITINANNMTAFTLCKQTCTFDLACGQPIISSRCNQCERLNK